MLRPCQLEAMSKELAHDQELARELTANEKLMRRWSKIRRRASILLPKLFSPSALMRKARSLAARESANPASTAEAPVEAGEKPARVPPLVLQPGEKVRVKSLEEIEKTLDEQDRTEGCTFTSAMVQYCGKECVVRKRIDLFFDERTWKLLKAKNLVILEGVYCQSKPDSFQHWAGCDRSCFLFWKEAWLERV